METVYIKYFVDDLERIAPNEKGDWIDLRAAQDVGFEQFENGLIDLGIGMKLPDGYEAHIAPRSSTYKNFGILQTNCPAIIDNCYCGDNDRWFYSVIAMRKTTIHKGDRICQFRIVKKQPAIAFSTVDHLSDKDRGGYGSTGTR